MTNHEYLKKMIAITEELDRIANHDPFSLMSWNMYMDEMHQVTCQWHHNRHRRPWFAIFIVCFLLFCLALVVWSILC